MRMSGFGQAASSALRPASVVTSQTTGVTFTPLAPSSLAVALRASAPRAQIVTSTPSRASAWAQPLPRPLEAAQTIAFLPLMPRSMVVSSRARCFALQNARLGCRDQAVGVDPSWGWRTKNRYANDSSVTPTVTRSAFVSEVSVPSTTDDARDCHSKYQ